MDWFTALTIDSSNSSHKWIGSYFTAIKVTLMNDDTAVNIFCCHFFRVPRWQECVSCVAFGAKEPNEVCGFVFFFLLVCRLKHLMGFLFGEVEIRAKPTVCTVPCLHLISVSICIRHCSGERLRIRFLTPGGGILPCFSGVFKTSCVIVKLKSFRRLSQ